MLTVPEAARVLRIGRTLAYQLTSRWLAGEPDGLPVVRIGGVLRVPRRALDQFLAGEAASRADMHSAITSAVDRLIESPPAAPRVKSPLPFSRLSPRQPPAVLA